MSILVPFVNDVLSDTFFNREPESSLQSIFTSSNMLKTDIKEGDNAYTLTIDLPGVKKEDINIDVGNGALTVSANNDVSSEEKDKNGNYIHRERRSGSFSRTFSVSKELDASKLKASYKDGVLEIVVPKIAEEAEKSTKVQID